MSDLNILFHRIQLALPSIYRVDFRITNSDVFPLDKEPHVWFRISFQGKDEWFETNPLTGEQIKMEAFNYKFRQSNLDRPDAVNFCSWEILHNWYKYLWYKRGLNA